MLPEINNAHKVVPTALLMRGLSSTFAGWRFLASSPLLYTYFIVKLEIPIGPALFVIGLSVAMNVWQTRRTNVTRRKDDQNFARCPLMYCSWPYCCILPAAC